MQFSNKRPFPQTIDLEMEYKRNTQAQVFSISSGKGGVGKTLSICHLALDCALSGKKVLILDGDIGMSNVDIILGLQSQFNIQDLIANRCTLEQAITSGRQGIDVMSSGSGIGDMCELSLVQKEIIHEIHTELCHIYDVILIDTGAGIGNNVCYMNGLASSRIIVTSTEPHAITDAYAMVKTLHLECGVSKFGMIVNMTTRPDEGEQVARRLRQVSYEYLGVDIMFLGDVPKDSALLRSIHRREGVSAKTMQTISGQAWKRIASQLFDHNICFSKKLATRDALSEA